CRHRGVKCLIGKRQVFGRSVDCWRKMRRTLSAHRSRRLDSGYVAIDRLVRARAGADVNDFLGVAKTAFDLRSNARIGLSIVRIADADLAVVNVAGTAVGMTRLHADDCTRSMTYL